MESLRYLKKKSIIHRDIKLANIMLGYDGIVKLCDFGCSKLIKDLDEKMNAKCGTPAFIAPEILIGKGYYGFQADIWSAGVVLYYILYGYKPFTGKDMNQISRAVVKAKY
jgi:5'-AMP-activated protein kinase catalytic alpha subunit